RCARFGDEYRRMHCRRSSYASVVLTLALGGLIAGCHKDEGPSPESQVQGLQLSTELERTKKKLSAAEKDSAAKDDAVALAKDDVERAKKELADKDKVVADKDARIHVLEGQMAEMKKQDAFVFAEASKLHQQNLNSTALDRYRQFVASFPASPLVADANRAIAELS